MAKKYWTQEEEKKLRDLWKKGITDYNVLGMQLGRPPRGIEIKVQRMGLQVVVHTPLHTTTNIAASKNLLTHEEALKALAGAIALLQNTSLGKLDLQRLRILVDALQRYDSVLEKFEKWVEIESRLLEMDKKIAELEKTKITA